MALSTTFMHCAPKKITQNKGHFAVQGHSRSPILVQIESSYTASYRPINTIRKCWALSLEFTNLLGIYIVGVARSLCRRLLRDTVIVNVHSYGFVNCFYTMRPETTKFGKITQNKSHFAVQGHSRSPILVPIESAYTTSY